MPASIIHWRVRYTVARLMPRSSLRMRSTRSSSLRWPSWRRNALTMKSRLLERLPPAGRTRSTSMECIRYTLMAMAAALFGRERRAASAGRGGVRVLDREPATRDGLDEIDFGAFQVPDADR